MTSSDLDNLINEFTAYLDGFEDGARIGERHRIFIRVLEALGEYHADCAEKDANL
jgi:hypothetical protein